jgi:hypothetical protein
MRRYWRCWESAMARTAGEAHGGNAWLRLFTPAQVGECGRHLQEAERVAEGDKVVRRIALARQGFAFTEVWTAMREHAGRGEWKDALVAGERARDLIRQTQGTVPSPFRVGPAVEEMEAALRPYREAAAAASP